MDKRLEEIILQIALEDYESGHITASDKESFNTILKDDFNLEASDEAFNFYAQCRNMGPAGFYLMYKDELDFSPEFKAEYGFEEEEEDLEEEPLTEASETTSIEDSYRVQEIDSEGNKLDQFANFGTADEAIAFAKTLKTPAEVIDNSMTESINEEKVIWTNLDTLDETLSRDNMIADLKAKGKNYNFNKYTDAQIYRMHQREMNKKAVESNFNLPEIDTEEDVEYVETSNCPHCKHQLTDAGQCPVCDLGDEEERISHRLYLDEGLFEEKVIDESEQRDILTEAPNFISNLKNKIAAKRGDIGAAANVATARELKEIPNKVKAIKKLLAADYADPNNTFYVDGKWINHRERSQAINANKLNSYIDDIAKIDPNSPEAKLLADAINTVVKNGDSYIIRRGLEKVNTPYNPVRRELLIIPDQYRAETLIGFNFEGPTNTESNSAKTSADDTSTEKSTQAETSEQTNSKTSPETPANWVNDNSIKAAITLLAKRKNGSAVYYDTKGNKIDYKTITPENVNDVFLDPKAQKSFMSALEEVKAGLAKRKAAAIKSAAIFGESLDDDIAVEEDIPVTDLDEGLSTADLHQVLDLAGSIGINTVGEMDRFAKENVDPGESILDTLRRYRDDLGDDFEVKESYLDSPETDIDAFDEI